MYIWYAGYWAPHIGYYGGINYGFGYTGRGYYGAYWNGGKLVYNRAVTDVDPARVHYVYDYTPPRNNDRLSFNGPGGVRARPTPQELAVSRDPRTAAVPAQIQHARQASANRAQFAGARGVRPDTLVASRPLSTGYHASAPHPPEEAMRGAARPTPEQSRPEAAAVPAERRPPEAAVRPGEQGPGPEAARDKPPRSWGACFSAAV